MIGVALILGGLGFLAKSFIKRGIQPSEGPFIMSRPRQADRRRDGRRCSASCVGLTSVGSGTYFGLVMVLVYPLTMSRIVGTDIFHAAALLWVAGIGHAIIGDVDWHAVLWLLIGSIPGILISSRWTVSVPQTTIRLGLGGILIISGIKLLDKNLPTWVFGSLLGGLALVVAVYTVMAMRAPAHGSRTVLTGLLNRRAVESARFAAGPLDGRPPGPAPGHRCRLRDHRAPEAHQEPDLRRRDVTKTFSPVCHCATDKAKISFKLRHPDSVTVTIVDSARQRRRHARADVNQPAKKRRRRSAGTGTPRPAIARDGSVYQPQVDLSHDRRTIRMPNKITVDTVGAEGASRRATSDGLLIAGGPHGVAIRYVFSEKAHAAVYLGGRRIIRGRSSRPSDKVKWNGKVGGKTLPRRPLRARGRARSTSPGTRRRRPSGSASSSGSGTSS